MNNKNNYSEIQPIFNAALSLNNLIIVSNTDWESVKSLFINDLKEKQNLEELNKWYVDFNKWLINPERSSNINDNLLRHNPPLFFEHNDSYNKVNNDDLSDNKNKLENVDDEILQLEQTIFLFMGYYLAYTLSVTPLSIWEDIINFLCWILDIDPIYSNYEKVTEGLSGQLDKMHDAITNQIKVSL